MYRGRSEAVGLYTPQSQFIMSNDRLMKLGFSQDEINVIQNMVLYNQKITLAELQRMGFQYEVAQKLKYLNDIATGVIVIDTKEDLIKHLRKMFGKHRKIGIQDLALSKIHEVPRYAVIAGIQDEVYKVLNSNLYKGEEMLYKVDKVTSRITIETDKPIVLKYGYPKKIEGVLEVLGKTDKGQTVIALDKRHCKLCNRYIIVASLKRPEFHLGMYEIVCLEGTKVYVYAQNMGTKAQVSYNGGTSRVYDYGYNRLEIPSKLTKIASEIYQSVCGFYAEKYEPNSDFLLIDKEKETSQEEEVEE